MSVVTATGAAGVHVAQPRLRGFLSQPDEVDDAPVRVEGTLPRWLAGDYLLNGPAIFDFGHGQFGHWFDGLAKLHRLHIDAAGVRYRSRLLQTEALRASRAADRPSLGGFDTPDDVGLFGRLAALRNPRRTDNAAVVMSRCGRQWLALTETDRVARFDPATLATQGELVWADGPKLPVQAAHPCIDGRGRWWNVGVEFGRICHYVLYSSGGDGRREIRARIPVARPGYLHAFAVTARRAVIWECAWRAHPLRFLFSGESYAKHFDWLPEGGSRLHAVDLADGSVRSWAAPALMVFHAAQAFDRGDDVVLDLCVSDITIVDDLSLAARREGRPMRAPQAAHRRFVLSAGRGDALDQPLPGRFDLAMADPTVAGAREATVVWGAGARDDTPDAFFNRTVRVDLATGEVTGRARDDAVMLEPLFVARPGGAENEGVLLVPTLADGDAGTVIEVLDAGTLDPRAALHLPTIVPFGFHAAFEPADPTHRALPVN